MSFPPLILFSPPSLQPFYSHITGYAFSLTSTHPYCTFNCTFDCTFDSSHPSFLSPLPLQILLSSLLTHSQALTGVVGTASFYQGGYAFNLNFALPSMADLDPTPYCTFDYSSIALKVSVRPLPNSHDDYDGHRWYYYEVTVDTSSA
jgi:hypothetical protein